MTRISWLALILVMLWLSGCSSSKPTVVRYPSGQVGHDLSHPQCSSSDEAQSSVAASGKFTIVGIDLGEPFEHSPCASSQWSSAAKLVEPPGLYMNTADPAPSSSYYWPTTGAHDPVFCADASKVSDPGCAYDYGWHAAADSLAAAKSDGITDPEHLVWWLDVEADNTWNGNGISHAADLQGSVDYLRSQGAPAVGIYTSQQAWTTITGDLNSSDAATYTSAWAPEFRAIHPLTSAPMWILGFGSLAAAQSTCALASPSGAPTWLVQFNDGSGHDADLACPRTTASSTPHSTTTQT